MGSGASTASDDSNSGQTSAASPRHGAGKPQAGGNTNNFKEVQVQPAKDHSTQDFRNGASKHQDSNRSKAPDKSPSKHPDKTTSKPTENNDSMKASNSGTKNTSASEKQSGSSQQTNQAASRSKASRAGQRSNQDTTINGQKTASSQQASGPSGPSGPPGSSGSAITDPYTSYSVQTQDDRAGSLHHPRRGKIPTYLFSEKQYTHCFFDRDTGAWLKLPLGWELHHEMIRNMVDQVMEAVPNWNDRLDILAALRVCNYNVDECISMYLHLEGDEWLRAARTKAAERSQTQAEEKMEKMQEIFGVLKSVLDEEKRQRKEAEEQVSKLQERLSMLEAEASIAKNQVEALQTTRPKTARPKTPQVIQPVVQESNISLDDLEILNSTAKDLHKSHVHLKMNVERHLGMLQQMVKEVANAAKQMKNQKAGQAQELDEIRALYQKEVVQRKMLYNQLQELRGNIRVFCRARKDDRAKLCLSFPTDQDIVVTNSDGTKKSFNFDKVFPINTTQEQIFTDTQPILTSCVDGYNVCLMAYGQTGSGKTYTMMGPDSNPGINVRAIKELMKVCEDRIETVTYTLKVSLVEIYNENVVDLLTKDAKIVELHAAGNNIRIPNLTEQPIDSLKDIKRLMDMGDKNRSTAATKMNSTSSRSHLVLMITVEGTNKVTGAVSRGILTLCDLAGSERVGKTEASGQRLVEAAAINKSLSALGQVFTALRQGQLHVPYRNSKLTQILRPSLGGDAKACLFVNISPDVSNYPETCNTLDFGSNARQVALGQAKQNVVKK
ncbi:kinesin-like protein KIN-14E isoform X2 [Gigantopelta aegis]|uniref:kinesin-like protein KIN-14E isoform X2 n=1 Tax=Gigantopelta aegis TaxID=1735272 RepID=UPI001B88AA43|nr:kinesin-like protein KIN-14E isoform X2 [Gigantopelta aegis]